MKKYMYELCLKWHSNGSAPDDDSGFLADVARMCFLVRFALFFQPRRSLCQRLPRLAQLAFPPKRLHRFLRGCVVTTAHGLVTAPSSAYVDVSTKMIWKNHIFARVMSGAVVIEEVWLHAAAAARIAGKSGMIAAATSGDVGDVMSCLMADANCVNEREHDRLDCTLQLLRLCLKFVADFVVHCVFEIQF
jgi:hypothetical protein